MKKVNKVNTVKKVSRAPESGNTFYTFYYVFHAPFRCNAPAVGDLALRPTVETVGNPYKKHGKQWLIAETLGNPSKRY